MVPVRKKKSLSYVSFVPLFLCFLRFLPDVMAVLLVGREPGGYPFLGYLCWFFVPRVGLLRVFFGTIKKPAY